MATSAISLSPQRPSSSSLRAALAKSTSDGRLTPSASRNPISSRLYKILGTNYDDPAIREALETLSELYSTPTSSEDSRSGQTAKGKGVDREQEIGRVPTASKDADDLDALDALGTKATYKLAGSVLGTGTAVRARKSLRRDAELKLTQGTQQFLRAFKEVDKVNSTVLDFECTKLNATKATRCPPKTY